MWTLRSPLTRSRYVDMTSGPGGRKENHQAVTADAWPPRRRLPTAGRRNFGAGAWRQLSGQCQHLWNLLKRNSRVKVQIQLLAWNFQNLLVRKFLTMLIQYFETHTQDLRCTLENGETEMSPEDS
ncbi:uncharacterized protein [Manis javanica]|uniref:uncharacterized protein isoform X5 n=1 Tax=Manis javanica TaxID=9974 RepID=UPI003C6D2CAE